MKKIRPKLAGMHVAVVQLMAAQNGSTAIGVIDAHAKQVIVVPSGSLPLALIGYDNAEELARYVAPIARLSVN